MRYHFHCTDGRELELDCRGRRLSSHEDVEPPAKAALRQVMNERSADLPKTHWSDWLVCVRNEFGEQAAVIPFCAPEPEWFESARLVFSAVTSLAPLRSGQA
jgi:hypothetical protein